MEHALSCAKGGFPTIRHNEIQDLTASLLTKVCNKVCVEPQLQPVTSNQLNGASANRQNGARLDVSANGVWGGRFQKTYLDVHVRVFNPLSPSTETRHQLPHSESTNWRKSELTSNEYKISIHIWWVDGQGPSHTEAQEHHGMQTCKA